MKKLLLILLIGSSLGLQAQKQLALVINGGKFEFGVDTYQDRATFGFIDYATQEYTVSDTIEVESVQKIASSTPNDGTIFVAAQDSILAYQYNFTINNFDKINQISFPSIKTITANQDYLIAGKWYGEGDYLVIYDIASLNEVYVSENINTEVKDLLIFQDTLLAVSYNLQGNIDNCAPYGCYTDSIGKIDVINLNKLETVNTIDLGARGKGNISLVAGLSEWSRLIVISSENALITAINNDFEIETDTINSGITSSISEDSQYNFGGFYGVTATDSLAIATFSTETKKFNIPKPTYAIPSKAIWNRTDILFTDTDYDSYGKVLLNFGSDTINVGISPEDIFVGEFGPMGIWGSSNAETNNGDVIYAKDLSQMDLEQVEIFSVTGQVVIQSELSKNINLLSMPSGMYIMKAEKDGSLISSRIIKE